GITQSRLAHPKPQHDAFISGCCLNAENGAPGYPSGPYVSGSGKMLMELSVDQVKFVAILAKAARTERDEFLAKVAEKDINGVQSAKGEHNPIAELGFEQLPPDASQAR